MDYKFKAFVRRLRELQGHESVSAFARRLEIPQKSLDCYIKGEHKPSVDLLLRVSTKCGVSADWLLGLSDERGPSQVVAPILSPRSTVRSPTRVAVLAPQSNSDLLAEIRALKARVAALESQPAYACG